MNKGYSKGIFGVLKAMSLHALCSEAAPAAPLSAHMDFPDTGKGINSDAALAFYL